MVDKLLRRNLIPDADQTAGKDDGGGVPLEPAADEGHTVTSDEDPNFNRGALEDKVGGNLSKIFDDDVDDDIEDEEDEIEDEAGGQEDESDNTGEDEDESDETDESDAEADEDDESDEADEDGVDDEEDDGEEAAATGAPTLPEAYRRSLKAYGWKDEEIDQNLEAMGDKFVQTAERIHGNRNAELQQWAKAGREARDAQQKPGQTDESTEQPNGRKPAQPATPQQQPSRLEPVDAAKLKEEYGDDEMVDSIVTPVNAAIEAINAVLPGIQQIQQDAQQQQVQQVANQVEKFFGQDDLAPYQQLYGNSEEGLKEEQLQHRNQVLDTAFNLMTGAETLHGQTMPLDEAMSYAHEIVAKDMKVTQARQGVKKEAKKRNRGLTQKPSRRGKKSEPETGEPESRSDLESRTARRLAKTFGR